MLGGVTGSEPGHISAPCLLCVEQGLKKCEAYISSVALAHLKCPSNCNVPGGDRLHQSLPASLFLVLPRFIPSVLEFLNFWFWVFSGTRIHSTIPNLCNTHLTELQRSGGLPHTASPPVVPHLCLIYGGNQGDPKLLALNFLVQQCIPVVYMFLIFKTQFQ